MCTEVGTTELEPAPSDLDKFWNVRVPGEVLRRGAEQSSLKSEPSPSDV
jgi:hypothetical protein